jgi:molecular chaperone GrpE
MNDKNHNDAKQKIADLAEKHFQAKQANSKQIQDEESENSEAANAKVSADLAEMEKEVTELRDALNDAQKKVDENWQTALRFRADIDNVRRQAERDVANAHKFSLEKFANNLLPIIDSLESGIANIESDPKALEDSKYKSICDGMHMTQKMFMDTLARFNVAVIDPLGQPFDPQWHEAMTMQPDASVPPGTVLMVPQKGYRLHDRLLRPARVIVSKAD